MYSISELSDLSGVSTRTLRYYDEIKILMPTSRSETGIRMYDAESVDRLQRILFFRTLGVALKQIKRIMRQPVDEQVQELQRHQKKVTEKIQELNNLNQAISTSIKMMQGEIVMTDTEKFRNFKEQQLAKSEVQFGNEIREKYGENAVKKANANYLNLTEDQFQKLQEIESDLGTRLKKELEHEGDLKNRTYIFNDHQQWLKVMAGDLYTKEYHHNIGVMYQEDQRFSKYYDNLADQVGAGVLLSEIILENTR